MTDLTRPAIAAAGLAAYAWALWAFVAWVLP
jgi:hypothetical protein